MESVPHGIAFNNRFNVFYEDEDADPLEILRLKAEERKKKKLEKSLAKDKKTAPGKTVEKSGVVQKLTESAPAKTTKANDNDVSNRPPRGKPFDRPNRNAGNFNNESREMSKNTRNREDNYYNADQKDGEFRGRGGYRGGRGGRERGRGYFPSAEGRNRRVFDRHSGSDRTGVRSVDKREGAGPNNWGDVRSEIAMKQEDSNWGDEFESGGDRPQEKSNWTTEDAKKDESGDSPKDESALDSSDTKENDQTEEQIQEAVKEMTLDEYKREQEAKRTVPKFNIRKPGEGEDDKKWKKGYILKKKPQDESSEESEEESEEEEDTARKGPQKVLLDFQFNYTDSRRGARGRGRGGRGGMRGGGRDAPREDRFRENRGPPKFKQAAPRVDDFNDFPSLMA